MNTAAMDTFDESEILKADPVQLVYSLVQAAEADSDDDSNNSTGAEEEDPVLDKNQAVRLDSNQPTSRLVRQETKEFLQTLHKYLDCRKQMDVKYLQVDELETLANFDLKIDSGGIELEQDDDDEHAPLDQQHHDPNAKNHGPSLGFKPEYQQQSISGQPVRNLNELYEAAEVAFPVYQMLIQSIMDRVGGSLAQVDCDDDPNGISVTFAPLKGKDRAQEKARDDYSERTPDPGVSWLFDIVRGSMLFSTADQMLAALQVLQEDPSIHIVKAKNRFRNPGLSGYRDWNIHIRIQVPKPEFGNDELPYFHHMCEIQMHHRALKALDKLLHSHQHYEYFRSYFAGSTDTLKERLADLELIDEGFSLGDDFDDDAFLDALLEAKPKEEEGENDAQAEVEQGGHNQSKNSDLAAEEARLVRLGRLFRLHLNEFDLATRVYGKLFSIQLDKYKDPRHVQIGYTFDRIGSVLIKQGKYDSAMILHRHAYEIKKVTLGNLDPSLAESCKCLAEVFGKQQKLTKSLGYSQMAVDIYKQIKGEESYEVGYIYGGMAAILRKQDKLDEALDLYKKAVEINIQENGEEDSSVAFVYNGMAWIYKRQGNLEEALRLFQRSHDISKRMYGDQHSSLCFTYNGIADILQKQDKLEEAMEMYHKSLSIAERRNGLTSPNVFFVYNKICKILKRLGQEDEAGRISLMLKKRESKRSSRNLQ